MQFENNLMQEISPKELMFIKQELTSYPNILVVELNGSEIQSWEDYALAIQQNFRFPTSCTDSIDRYLDWIRDLSWIEREKYILVIHQYDKFLQQNPKLKNDILADFTDIILPFWQEEVESVVVGGKAKTFMVYLVKE
ncbi:hypothetical protein J2Z69_001801 [Paenibacillus shirakamiensis]|uniref:Barstar (barnase inhibitor) domain-containing protein n=1 Tax=Paenibacillus shirakamiensis TaxID=1265935 RepID=A0ABS4JI72_9BACL|nr:barstar family protein [Paenibacillus shirakamiensis]MBP2000770.1 hypothetical protein [Paenibacillus shirakamiensis]